MMNMDTQRLRNLTTKKLHTEMDHIYQDMEFLTGMEGIMTHMLPNILTTMLPWLKSKVTDCRYWDDQFDTSHTGTYEITPMNADDKKEVMQRYSDLPHPFFKRKR